MSLVVVSSLCQWGFQASYWADSTDSSVCNSPSTIFCFLNSPLLLVLSEGLCLLPFTWKNPQWLDVVSCHGSIIPKVWVQGKCHVEACDIGLWVNSRTEECYKKKKKITLRVWTWYCFLKRTHIWLLYAILVAVCFPPGVFWNCCGAPQSQSQGGARSSQPYCFRATQDSRGVSLPQRWLHNSHALNGAPSSCFQLEFIIVNCRNFFRRVNSAAFLFRSQKDFPGPKLSLPSNLLKENEGIRVGRRGDRKRAVYLSSPLLWTEQKKGTVEADGERTQKLQDCNYLP